MFLWLQSLCFSSVETSKNFPILKDCRALSLWPSLIKDRLFSFCQPHQALHWKHHQIKLWGKAFKYRVSIICSNTQKCHHKKTEMEEGMLNFIPEGLPSLCFSADWANLCTMEGTCSSSCPQPRAWAFLSSLLHSLCQRDATKLHLRSILDIFSCHFFYCMKCNAMHIQAYLFLCIYMRTQ